ncbi:MAG: hypothetical protein U0U66_13695 [Cytophagaceae bacterium]
MIEIEKLPPLWNENMRYFYSCLNLQDYGFEINLEESYHYLRGEFVLYKKTKEFTQQIRIKFNQEDLIIGNLIFTISINSIEDYLYSQVFLEAEPYKMFCTFHFDSFSIENELREYLFKESKSLRYTNKDDKIQIQEVAELFRRTCINEIIPLLDQWSSLNKIYNEILYPIMIEKKTYLGESHYSAFIGMPYKEIKFIYIMKTMGYHNLSQFINNHIFGIKIGVSSIRGITEEKRKLLWQEEMDLFTKHITRIGIDYDFSHVKYEE